MADKLTPLAVPAAVAARFLVLSRPTIYTLIHRGDFPSFKVGSRTLVSAEGLRAWVQAQADKEAVE